MRPTALIVIAGLALLAGCATLDEDECRNADWYDLGYRDGMNGEPAGRMKAHRKACSDYGVRPDEARYREGREAGLREYCDYANAFRAGLNGQRYQGVCPREMDRTFDLYNAAAYEVHRLRKEMDGLDDAVDGKERRLRDKKTSDQEKGRLRDDIRDLDRKRDRLRVDLRQAERDLDRLMDEARARERGR